MDATSTSSSQHGGSMVMLAKGNRSQQVTDACKKHGGFYLGSIGGPAARLAQDCIKKVEVLEYPELGMEAVWKIDVESTSRPSSSSTTRATTSSPASPVRAGRVTPRTMRRALLVVGYVFQAGLGLIILGLAAVSTASTAGMPASGSRPEGRPSTPSSTSSSHTQGPSLP
jgi:hypothetical protein